MGAQIKLANSLHLHLFRLHTGYICIYMVFCSLLQTLHRDINFAILSKGLAFLSTFHFTYLFLSVGAHELATLLQSLRVHSRHTFFSY